MVKVVVGKEWGMAFESLGGGFENLKIRIFLNPLPYGALNLRTAFLNVRRLTYGATLTYRRDFCAVGYAVG
jgi:hypothetical protein